ncbi:MAG TPA: hypothetical protein PKW95_01080 [bacterium]|nr:hypothetical protein [bacterium]
MGYKLSLSAVQKVRLFLAALNVSPSPYSSTSEVLDLLIAKVKEHRHDARLREQFAALIDELQTEKAMPAAPDIEALDTDSLAEELIMLLAEPSKPFFALPPTMYAVLAILAVFLLGMAVTAGCRGPEDSDGCDCACAEDVSLDHFLNMLGNADNLTVEETIAATELYDDLSKSEQQDLITRVCAMSPDEIIAFIETGVAQGDDDSVDDDTNVPDDDSIDDDSFIDDDVVYKGVAF